MEMMTSFFSGTSMAFFPSNQNILVALLRVTETLAMIVSFLPSRLSSLK